MQHIVENGPSGNNLVFAANFDVFELLSRHLLSPGLFIVELLLLAFPVLCLPSSFRK